MPRMVRSPVTSKSLVPTHLLAVVLKVMVRCWATSRKSLLRRWLSRWGSPVHRLCAWIVASMDRWSGLSGSNSSEPCTSLKWPRTQDTIMCRARNSAAVWPGWKSQVGMRDLVGPNDADRRGVRDPRGAQGLVSFGSFRVALPLSRIQHDLTSRAAEEHFQGVQHVASQDTLI